MYLAAFTVNVLRLVPLLTIVYSVKPRAVLGVWSVTLVLWLLIETVNVILNTRRIYFGTCYWRICSSNNH